MSLRKDYDELLSVLKEHFDGTEEDFQNVDVSLRNITLGVDILTEYLDHISEYLETRDPSYRGYVISDELAKRSIEALMSA